MFDQLQRLIDLQKIDSDIKRINVQRGHCPRETAKIQAKIKEAADKVESFQAEQNSLKKEIRHKEGAIRDNDVRIASYNEQLYTSLSSKDATAYEKMQSQTATARKKNDALETWVLEAMETVEERKEELKIIRRESAKEKKEGQAKIAKIEARRRDLDKALAERQKKRAGIRTGIDEAYLHRYEALSKRSDGRSVVPADNFTCTGCNRKIQPQEFIEIRRNDSIHNCPYCDRILYYVPKEPEE